MSFLVSTARLRSSLLLIGCVAIVVGVGTILYSVFILRPKIAAFTHETRLTVAVVEKTMELLTKESQFVSRALRTLESGGAFIAKLPDSLHRAKVMLADAASASVSTGNVANQTKKGAAGLVLPKQELAQTSEALKKTAEQMRKMSADVETLEVAAAPLGIDAAALSENIAGLEPKLTSSAGVLPQLTQRLESMQQALGYSALETQTMLLGLVIGGLYLLFGSCALAVGFLVNPERPTA
jgi:hypothetical protein